VVSEILFNMYGGDLMSDHAATESVADLLAKGTLTVQKAVVEYGIGRTRLYSLMMDGTLPYSQIGSRRLIPRQALENLIAKNLIGTSPEMA
jgi:excisionase family DNA binding protein